jgi:hypothetical protein
MLQFFAAAGSYEFKNGRGAAIVVNGLLYFLGK